MKPSVASRLLPLVVALGVAVFAVTVDLHNYEPQAAGLVLVAGGFVVGVLWPRHAWRWALLMGLSIFVGDPIGVRLGVKPPWPEQGINWGSLVALIPALVGTYCGVGVRRLLSAATRTIE